MAKQKWSLRRSCIIGIAAFVLLLCLVLGLAHYWRYRAVLYGRYRESMADVLSYVSGDIDVDDLAECMRTGEKSEKYAALQQELDHLRDRTNLRALYVVVPLSAAPTDGMMNVIAGVSQAEYQLAPDAPSLLNRPTGDAYSQAAAQKYLNAYLSGRPSFFEQKRPWGRGYTGLVPLKDSRGYPVAALCVDADVSGIRPLLWGNTLGLAAILLALGAAFGALCAMGCQRYVTGPIGQLEKSMTRFVASCKDQRDPEALRVQMPDIDTGNELDSLAAAATHMGEAMQDYVKSITFTESELARIAVLANKDALTEVRNKNAYDAYAIELQSKMRNGQTSFAMLMADLNDLKSINERFGHEKGDIYIQQCCQKICELFTHSPVFRVGGDEFVIVLQGPDYRARDTLLGTARVEFHLLSKDTSRQPWERCSVSFGMATTTSGSDQTVGEILEQAEKAMYEEKAKLLGGR